VADWGDGQNFVPECFCKFHSEGCHGTCIIGVKHVILVEIARENAG